MATITNTDSATQGSGTVLNQCEMTYNAFGQLVKEEQAHGGPVATGTPSVQYGYATGSSISNQIRPTGLTYPDGRAIAWDYGPSGDPDDRLNRINAIQDGSTGLAAYTYLGLGTVVRITYPQPGVWLDLWGGTSGTFNGLDRFNRVVDQRWQNAVTTAPADVDRYQYGYDRDANRTWKRNVVSAAASVPLDEFYAYDQLNRLTAMRRGALTGTPPTGIAGTPVLEQDWTLDPTGNWRGYVTKDGSGTTTLNQSRASSPVNEITGITETTGPSWVDPAYDAAGNTTTFPQPASPTLGLTATHDAWNRMTSVKNAGIAVADYKYDGRNRRVVTTIHAGGSATDTHAYFTDAWEGIEERVGGSTAASTQHVWGLRYVDELVCRDDPANGRLYACQDANFNVTALLAAAGTVLQRLVYEPYGADSVRDAAWAAVADAYAWRVRFQGLPLDPATLLYLARNRDYNSRLGAWMQRDPLGYTGDSSLYTFASRNPLRYIDPMGLEPVDCGVIKCDGECGTPKQECTIKNFQNINPKKVVASCTVDCFVYVNDKKTKRSIKCEASTYWYCVADILEGKAGWQRTPPAGDEASKKAGHEGTKYDCSKNPQ